MSPLKAWTISSKALLVLPPDFILTTVVLPTSKRPLTMPPVGKNFTANLARSTEALIIPVLALIAGLALFGLFLLTQGKSPVEFYSLVYKAGFSSSFSWQNTLNRASPLILAALCVAIPARLGLVIIGGEGAIVLGGLAAACIAGLFDTGGLPVLVIMSVAGMLAGAFWIGISGALRYYRGVNETISSLLLTYIAIAVFNHIVEGPLRDPLSLNKPSTAPLAETQRIGNIPGFDVHWGLPVGIVICVFLWILIERTTVGFSIRVTGANIRAAQIQGFAVGKLTLAVTFIGGACAGLAGMIEVSAIHGSANASLIANIGYSGILVAFLARHNALAIVPVTLLLAGFDASGGLVQRRMDLPDATVLVLQGFVFISILASESCYGRFSLLNPEKWQQHDRV